MVVKVYIQNVDKNLSTSVTVEEIGTSYSSVCQAIQNRKHFMTTDKVFYCLDSELQRITKIELVKP
jgi:hypothetical protein